MIDKNFRRYLLFILICLIPAASLSAQPVIFAEPLSPRTANYVIDVRLDTQNKMLHAHEVMTWHNQSADTLTEIQFHLYLNAFRNNKSTLYEESGGSVRGLSMDDDGWGFTEITRIALSPGEDLTARMEFIQPDNDDQSDKTVMRLPLPVPLPPNDSVQFEMDFIAKLPTPPLRTGYKEEFFFIGQWYPKAGVYVDGAWNCHQFHADAEFFADFGVYDVHITVPEDNIVGATGLEVEVISNNDGTATHYYHAEDIHDFAWTTSPEFVEFTGDTLGVAIRVLMQPDRVNLAPRYLEPAKATLAYFAEWIGDYPFPNLTIVDPRRGALNAGGMEYPTLFTAFGMYGIPAGMRLLESTIVHEFAHNYWHHMVATNEFEEAWLDEGFTVYSEMKIMNDLYGSAGNTIDLWGIKINQQAMNREAYIGVADTDPMARAAWEYYTSWRCVVNSYYKPGLMLSTLENYLGEEKMQRIMRTYYERWRFKHPQTQDFIAIANEVSGQDLHWFFDQAIYSNVVLDYGVTWLTSRKVKTGKGYDFTLDPFNDDRTEETTTTDTGEIADDAEDEEEMYYSVVKVRRMGAFVFPVEIEITFADGETIRETWDGRDTWTKFSYTRPAKLASATVDPKGKILLDVNLTNNGRTLEGEGIGVVKLCARLLFWAQFIMEQPAFANLLSIIEGFSIE
ncbi:M1 family metallopeptidase [Candidatus Zixiibacteriota bacterium]